MKKQVLDEASAFVYDKLHKENFQVHDDWINWRYDGTEYDINIFTDFHTGKAGATIYPVKRTEKMNIYETDTLKGVRLF